MARLTTFQRGALYMVASACCFAAMGAAVKTASATLGNSQIVFCRNLLSLLLLLPWCARGGVSGLATEHLGEHLVRGLFGLSAMYGFFYAIAHVRLADALLLNYTLPLFMPPIERLWLGERMSPRLLLPLGLGFLGILVILRPGTGVFQPVALWALVSALLGSVAQVGVRRLTATEPVARIVFYFAAIATLVSAGPALFTWQTPTAGATLALLFCGVAATLGQLLLTRAYASAPAAWVGPFLYSSVVFAGLFDALIWGRSADALFVLGALLVIAAGVLTLRLRREPALPEPIAPDVAPG